MEEQNTYTAFEGTKLVGRGSIHDVVLKIKKRLGKSDNCTAWIFNDLTGKIMDFNFQGTEKDVLKRLDIFSSKEELKPSSGPGRPKLGVISREVSLLPRHWEWLAGQPSGASATLRRLIEEAKKKSHGVLNIKQMQERTYKVMSVLAGDLNSYEEALRALYKRDEKKFSQCVKDWPKDVQNHLTEIARPVFEEN